MHYVISRDGLAVTSFKSERAAHAFADAGTGAHTASDESLKDVPTALLVVLHNRIRPEKPVKKFENRETAEKRLSGVLEVLARPGVVPESTSTEDTTVGGKNKAIRKAARKEKAEGAAPTGRASAFAGKKIIKVAEGNPRREGTHGFDSYASFRSGVTYETYLANGGRRQDLAWDLAKGYVKLES